MNVNQNVEKPDYGYHALHTLAWESLLLSVSTISIRAILALALLVAAPAAFSQRNLEPRAAQGAEQRVALVIGNAAYQQGALRNPVNDARAMAERLQRLGFVVIKRENMKAKEIGPALREFRSRLSAGAVALFFYAGHGLQVKGVNYLPTVDADIEAEEDVYTQALDVAKVLELMEEAKTRVNLVFLDACRNNPFSRRFRSVAQGLAKVDAASGTLISFATRPGSVAADGEGRNGLYTEYLLKHMEEPGLPIEQVLKRAGAGVKLASKGRQEPWSEGLIEGEFYFRAAAQTASPAQPSLAAPAPTLAPDPVALELLLWESIKDSRNPEELGVYLEQFPQGRFAGIAQARIKEARRASEESTRAAEEAQRRDQQAQQRYTQLLAEGDAHLSSLRKKEAIASYETAAALIPGATDARSRLEKARATIANGDVIRDRLKDGSPGPEMVIIPAGTFRMGGGEGLSDFYTRAMNPPRDVTIRTSFAMGRYEVTFDEYDRFTSATGRDLHPDQGWGRGTRPVVKVPYADAMEYTAWLSAQTGKRYRIPSEAEWEYAARGGTNTLYWWGNEPSHDHANYGSGVDGWLPSGVVAGKDRWEYTAPVGQFAPNPFGLYDMQGNVWEWVSDCWHYDYNGAPKDGSAWVDGNCSGRVMRGGSWGYEPRFMQAAMRIRVYFAVEAFLNYGIRLVRELD